MAAKKKATTKTQAAAAAQPKPPTKTEILNHIATQTGLSKKDVGAVMDSLQGLIEKSIKPRGVGMFTLPGLLKIKVVKKPATKARKGRNPATGEEMIFKAKPARKVVKVLPLKNLKDMI
ncbi:HU family DNA-binding protein [Thioalkalivibrio sulfidiphilus]|uniref:HU family DNA-binding protein n=1 Tax=Thioalkalivibrio sulfidiphilus TaxID=1033854 RepID=UPI00036A07AE|nr:HU family DNA-binding protein [Thioalkalivibrio sulfidiphilus]